MFNLKERVSKVVSWYKSTRFYKWWINTPLIEQRQNPFKPEPIQWKSSSKNIYKITPNPKAKVQFNPYYIMETKDDYGTFPSYGEAEKAAPAAVSINEVTNITKTHVTTLESTIPAIQSI